MKTKDRSMTPHLWAAISLLLLSANLETDAQVKKMTSKDMTEVSTAVLYGKCKKIKCEWNENRSAIYTYVTIAPEGYIKGNLGQEVIVMVPGGRVDDILYEVSETPFFIEDEDVVAFIWTNPKGKNLITGGFQGKMKIEKDENTGKRYVNDTDDDAESVPGTQGSANQGRPAKMELEDYVTKLKGYAKN
jgi:hypothetical protein